ncbi:MAG: translation initiation factor [Campylobacterales bacterium]
MRFKLEGLQSSDNTIDTVCKKCGELQSECVCNAKPQTKPKNEYQIVLSMEKRNGKPVSIAGTFHLSEDDAKALLTKLKKSLAVGGTIKDGKLEFQGEHRDRLRELLKKEGFGVKN